MGEIYDAAAVEALCVGILEGMDTPPETARESARCRAPSTTHTRTRGHNLLLG